MAKILTWDERCEIHPDHQEGMVTHAMIQMRMYEEIDDLRDRILSLEAALRDVVNYLPAGKRHNLKKHIRIAAGMHHD